MLFRSRPCADVEFAINLSVAGATGLSPFECTYGYQPSPWPVDAWSSTDVPAADGFAESIRLNWLKATDTIIGARLEMAVQANKHQRPDSAEFSVGNRVYVNTKDLSFPALMTRKFLPCYLGPFPITAANPSSSNYDIAFPPHFRVHPRVHASKLCPFFANDETRFPARHFSTPPDLAPADAANVPWTIEKIITDRVLGSVKQRSFLVRFLEYSTSEDHWLSELAMVDRHPRSWSITLRGRVGSWLARGEKRIRRVK